ncbi:MAG TPA: DUF2934 domain-containing protein [Chthoniobacter sp.]|nr:DUF2934 domain-containing protein [Chthoniobacter sp.]
MSEIRNHPDPEEIGALAKLHWEEEGRPEGKALEHWHRAESELRRQIIERLAAASASPNPPVVQGIS